MSFDFGFRKVEEDEKKTLVSKVFSKVADKYDLMNNIMSFGIQKIWKSDFIDLISLKNGGTYIDLASGSGDISRNILKKAVLEGKNITIHVCDASFEMLELAKKNLIEEFPEEDIHFHTVFAEELSFAENSIDGIFISFGIRNFTNLDTSLSKIYSCLKEKGSLYILEFFPDVSRKFGFSSLYNKYLSKVIPRIGKIIVGDSSPYEYFAQSIIAFSTRKDFQSILLRYGFKFFNITNSVLKIVSFFQFKK